MPTLANVGSITQMTASRHRFCTSDRPTAKWKLFRECNLSCTYCHRRRAGTPTFASNAIDNMVRKVCEVIPNTWRIYLTGGEPTLAVNAVATILRLFAAEGHELRLITNLTGSVEDYRTLAAASGGKLQSLFVTRHVHVSSHDAFIAKAKCLRACLPAWCRITVRQVVLPSTSSMRDYLTLRSELDEPGLTTYPLRLVLKHNGAFIYSAYTRACTRRLAKQVFAGCPHYPDRQGTYCPAGFQYVYIDPQMDVFRCIPYKTLPEGFMGNLWKDRVHLLDSPTRCKLPICTCVPGR